METEEVPTIAPEKAIRMRRLQGRSDAAQLEGTPTQPVSESHTHPSRVVKNGSVVSIFIVETKRGGDREKTGGVSSEMR
jgi:hypothetical protein